MAKKRDVMTFDPSALKRIRKATGWGLHKLAVELAREGIVDSITAETIRKFELGVTEPRVSLFFAISRVLNVPAVSLLRARGPRGL